MALVCKSPPRSLSSFSIDDLTSSLPFLEVGRSDRELADALRAAFGSSNTAIAPSYIPSSSSHPSAPLNTPSGTPHYAYFPLHREVSAPAQHDTVPVPIAPSTSPYSQWSLVPNNSPANAFQGLPRS